MEIRLLDYIAINESQSADSSASKINCGWTPQSTHSHNEDL
jgi:hypothetical protein